MSCEGLIELLGCTRLRSLRRLSLNGNQLGREGILALANAPVLSELEELELLYMDIDDVDVSALATSPFLRKISSLSIDVDETGADALSQSFSQAGPSRWKALPP